MPSTMQITVPSVIYAPMPNVLDRHTYSVSKNRRASSTGGGRAWSEDEEAYLLQTRLQKMPYKHIAAHLRKTELACRLHHHQLSHSSNRRKRTTSLSSESSTGGHSPTFPASMPSPIQEDDGYGASSRSASPLASAGAYAPTSPNSLQLPSILATASGNTSPRLPVILPKPASITLAALANPGNRISPIGVQGYPPPIAEPHSASQLPSANFCSTTTASSKPPYSTRLPGLLRLDCSALPPAASSTTHSPSSGISPSAPVPYAAAQKVLASSAQRTVDMSRLNAVYAAHRASFWTAVAADYGAGIDPFVLEQAWRTGSSGSSSSSWMGMKSGIVCSAATAPQGAPITPVASPDEHVYSGATVKGSVSAPSSDKTRISAILGIDANPMSPRERERVRRLEEEKCMVGTVSA